MKEARDLQQQAERGLARQNKILADKAAEHRADASNYHYDGDELVYAAPDGSVFKVVGNAGQRQFVKIKGARLSDPETVRAAEGAYLDEAMRRAKSRKISSIIRE